MPFAYFVTGLVVYAYSFVATLRKMAENSRMSKLSEKDDECIFSWKLFTAWDYMIGNAETAHNKVASIIMVFKEALVEEAQKKRESRKWKVIFFRILVNTVVLGLLTFSAYAVIMVVKRSTEKGANSTVWRKNEITIVMSLITLIFPMLFEVLGLLEQYHPRKQLRLQLARIMVLNLLNLYSLIIALFHKISFMTSEQQYFKNISCTQSESISESAMPFYSTISYLNPYNENDVNPPMSANLISDFAFNISSKTYRRLLQLVDTDSRANDEPHELNFDYYVDYFGNSTFPNYSDILYDNSVRNISSFVNETIRNYNNVSIFADLKDLFVDHLTHILSAFKGNETDIMMTNISNVNTSDIMYNVNETDFVENTFNSFKSSIMHLITNQSDVFKTQIEETLLNSFNEVNATLSSFDESITSSPMLIYKTNVTISPYNVASDTTLPGFGGDNFTIISTTASSYLTSTSYLNSYSTTYFIPRLIKGNYSTCAKLRSLCWETMFGQELIKLTIMDLIMTILYTLSVDVFRGIFVRVMNRCWCWDLEKKFPQYGDFKVAENILHLVNNQGMVWMGMFFSPGLVVLNVIKLHIMMYFRTWAVLTCNVPHEVIFRASRSNNFYYALLLMMLFLCVLPVGYAIVIIKPSFHCGPFSGYERIFHIFTQTIKNTVPESFQEALDYIASPGIVIPLLVLLVLIIYYLISLTGALREANEDLKIQLRRERTEERRKMFQIVDRRRVGSVGSNDLSNTPFAKFKKIYGALPSGKSFDDTPKQESENISQSLKEKKSDLTNKDFLIKLFKRALRKPSVSEEEPNVEDGTDTEPNESLPYDTGISKQQVSRPTLSWNNSDGSFPSNDIPRKHPRRSESVTESTDPVNTTTANIQNTTSKYSNVRNYIPDLKKRHYSKTDYVDQNMPSTSKDMSQDIASPAWSENIPVITISKTDSAENIVEDNEMTDLGKNSPKFTRPEYNKNKPKVKCAFTKQSTIIDENTVCHFNKELQRNLAENEIIKSIAEKDLSVSDADYQSVYLTDQSRTDDSSDTPVSDAMDVTEKSTSEDTECTNVTVVKSPYTTEKE